MLPPRKPLFATNKTAFADSTLQANKGKDWVKRLYEKNTPTLQIPGEPHPSTHYMGDNGQGYVFPTVVRKPGQQQLSYLNEGAEAYARKTNTGIQFKNKEQGDFFGHGGYKKGTGVLKEFMKGTSKVKLPKAAKGLQGIKIPKGLQGEDCGLDQGAAIGAGAGLLATGIGLLEGPDVDADGIPRGGSALGVLGSAASGAASGAAFGPIGAAIGGVVGLGTGIMGSVAADKARVKAQEAQKTRMQQRNWDQVSANPSVQMSQYKAGSKKVATKAIEIEGGEPHFSAMVNGKRVLKYFAADGPKHSQGGIPTIAASGDAIVTAKGAKGAQAVAAHQRGDHATVEKLINQMPEDKGTKKRLGAATIKPPRRLARPAAAVGLKRPAAPTQADMEKLTLSALGPLSTSVMPSVAAAGLGPIIDARNPYMKIEGNTTYRDSDVTSKKSTANGIAQAAPTIYNLGQGLFGNVEQTTRRNYSPQLQQYQDLSGPQRQASRQAQNQQVSNARNLSGGSAGNLRSNAAAAYADNAQRQSGIDAQETGRQLAINGQNTESRNQAQLQNNAMNNQADIYDLQNAAKKSEALSKGLEGISGLASNSLLQKNTLAKENADRNMLGQAYKNFTYTAEQNIELRKQQAAAGLDPITGLPKKKKGTRSIKVKGC